MRKVRPDGNCFFRGFGFSTLENCIKNKDEFAKFRKVIEDSKSKLIQLNFPQFTIDDFYEVFMEVLDKVEPREGNEGEVLDQLYKLFNEQAFSDYIVVYLRLITSGEIRERSDLLRHGI
jgi:ubiquitin thioesterase protein OTUB1